LSFLCLNNCRIERRTQLQFIIPNNYCFIPPIIKSAKLTNIININTSTTNFFSLTAAN